MRHPEAVESAAVERIDDTAPRALRIALAQQPDSVGKVLFAWSLAAGPALSRSASVRWTDGVLHIEAKSRTWRDELLHARPVLMARLTSLLGPGTVQSLHISFVADAAATHR